MLFSLLKKIDFKGTLELIDSKNNLHIYGNVNPKVRVRLKSKSIEKKLFRNPSLHLGEGYMNEEIIIEEGSIEQFIDIITSSYDDFVKNNTFYKYYENLSSYFKTFHPAAVIYNQKLVKDFENDIKKIVELLKEK